MRTIHIKERIGNKYEMKESTTDVIEVVSINYKEQLYNCKQIYDGLYDGNEFYFLDIPFNGFEEVVKI